MEDYYSSARTISQLTSILEQRMIFSSSGSTSKLSFRKVLSAYRAEPAQNIDGFDLINNQLSTSNPNIFDEDPEKILRLFRHCQRLGASLSPDLRSLIRNRLSLVDSSLINSSSANVTFRQFFKKSVM